MTIEEILGMSAKELMSFDDKQLHEWFAPMFPTTRPEQVAKKRHEAEQFELKMSGPKVFTKHGANNGKGSSWMKKKAAAEAYFRITGQKLEI